MNIVIAHFNSCYVRMPGGVEKVTCNLANAMTARGHSVTILYRESKEGHAYFPLDERVPEHNILYEDGQYMIQDKLPRSTRIKREFFRLFNAKKAHEINAVAKGRSYGSSIRKWLEKLQPDVIVSTSMPSTKYVVEDAAASAPVITMIHSQPAVQFAEISSVECRAVNKCAGIQILLPSGIEITRKYFPHLPIYVIGNAVSIPEWHVSLNDKKDRYKVICVGTLNANKNQKLAVDAFAGIADHFPQWDFELWGLAQGSYARTLKDHIKSLNMEGRIFIKGQTKDVDNDAYKKADLFIIPSKKEGWGLSLTEAMAVGLPAIGLKSCPGVNELIQDGVTGYLVEETISGLQDKMARLMKDRAARVRMGMAGREAIKPYEADTIWDKWEKLLIKTAEKGPDAR